MTPDLTLLPGWPALDAALGAPQTPLRALMITPAPAQRDAAIEQIAAAHDSLRHLALDLSRGQVVSLLEEMETRLSDVSAGANLRRIRDCIHLTGLETSTFQEILDGTEVWLPAVAAEWPVILDRYPCHLVLWTDAATAARLEQQAPDWHASFTHTLQLEAGPASGETVYEAIRTLAARREDPSADQAAVLTAIARHLYAYGKYVPAAGLLEQALEAPESPAQAEAHFELGRTYFALREAGRASEHLHAAIEAFEAQELPERQAEAHRYLAELLRQAEEFDQAIRHFRRAQELHAGESPDRVWQILGRLYERKGALDTAAECYEQAAASLTEPAQAADLAAVWQQVGAIRQNQQRYPEALAAFKAALAAAQQGADEFLLHALEDSVEQMEEQTARDSSSAKKGWLGRLFG